jgi:hypothetical protein
MSLDGPGRLSGPLTCSFRVEAKGLEPSNLLTASQALYQLSYAPEDPQDYQCPWRAPEVQVGRGRAPDPTGRARRTAELLERPAGIPDHVI